VPRSTLSQQIQKAIGHPGLNDFLKIVESNLLVNCPIVKQNILAAEDIFGPELGGLKGKTVRAGSKQVKISYPTTSTPAAYK